MIIIAFSCKTSKILPRIFCRHFRHCATIIPTKNGNMTLYQFVRRGHVAKINIKVRDISILYAHGWRFVCMPINPPADFDYMRAITCVDLAKRATGIRAWHTQTPDALYKKIRQCRIF